MAIQGNSPYQIDGGQTDRRVLFYSNPNIALILPIRLQKGFGVLKAGTVLGKNDSANGYINEYSPREPDAKTGAENAPGRSFLVVDGASSTSLWLTLDDSYRYKVGDTLDVIDADSAIRDLGAITAIDRTTYRGRALLTVTNQVTTAYTVAGFAHVMSSGTTTAAGILDTDVDTGTGENAQGAVGSMVVKNAILYDGSLLCIDSTAATSLGMTTFGQYRYF